jgi:hypothetical protein
MALVVKHASLSTEIETCTETEWDEAHDVTTTGDTLIVSKPTIGAFTSITGAIQGSLRTSNSATVTGDDTLVWPFTVRGSGFSPEVEINGSGVWATSGVIRDDDTVKIRYNASASGNTERIATLYTQGASATFSVTTGDPVTLTYSQSALYGLGSSVAATEANMTDGLNTAYAATQSTADDWIKVALSAPIHVNTVYVRPTTTTDGWGAAYLNGRKLQKSDDNSNWTDVHTFSEATNGGPEIAVTINATTQYVRVHGAGYVAITELRLA